MQLITIFVSLSIFFYKVSVIETQTVDIVQTAINNGNFQTLVAALQAADLVTTLKSNGPFTVFAPTDAAFSKLPPGTVNDLIKPENKEKLTRILKYHVINGLNLTSSQINSMTLPANVQMLEGNNITVSKDGNNLKVNDATVVIADVIATNGIIHAIDTVLMPPAATVLMPPAASLATSFSLNYSLLLTLVLTIIFSYT